MAGVDVGTAYLTVVPSAKGFAGNLQRELGSGMTSAGKRAGSDAAAGFGGSFKSGISNVAKAGALLLAGVAAGGVAFVKDSIGEARESQKVGAITAQIIKSTGGVAKISAEQVGDLATAISNKTGVDDEAIQSGANMLLTFKNVRNEVGEGANVFDRATQAAADLSAAGFGDMAGQSKMLGKALNDPVKGISALSRSGVTFTDQQKKQIKTLVASGKTLEAQKIILGEVESQVGGTAAASATAGEKLATAWGNFKEGIGTSLLPVVDKLANFLKDRLLPGAQGIIDIFAKGKVTDGFAKAFHVEDESKFADFLFGIRDAFKALRAGFSGDVSSYDGFLGVVAKIGDAFGAGLDKAKEFIGQIRSGEGAGGAFRDGLSKAFDYLKATIPPLVESAKKLWPPFKDIAKQLFEAHKAVGISTWAAFKPIIEALPGILDSLAPMLENVAKWMGENKELVGALVAALGAGIAAFKILSPIVKTFTIIQGLLNVVMSANPIGLIVIAIAALAAGLIYAYKNSETFRKIVDTAFHAIAEAGRWMWNNVLAPVIRYLISGFSTVAEWIANMLDALSNVPGFGWAKDAANKMHGAAKKAEELSDMIKDIPETKQIDVKVGLSGPGVKLLTQSQQRRHADVFFGEPRRAAGGPVSANRPYWVGDNPDGSLNGTSELFVPRQSGQILNQAQIAAAVGGGGGGLSQSDIDRLAYAMSQVRLQTTVAASSVDRALGANW